MRKSRFSEEQKVKMLREAERSSVAAVAKKHGVSTETIYRWRRSFGGMEVSDVKRLKQLEQENARIARHRRGGESSLTARRRARSARDIALGQRTGVRVACRARMAKPSRREERLHRARQALAERHQRELQREVSRRVPQHALVSQPCRSSRVHRAMATRVQRGSTSFEHCLLDPGGIPPSEPTNPKPWSRGGSSALTAGPKKWGRSSPPRTT